MGKLDRARAAKAAALLALAVMGSALLGSCDPIIEDLVYALIFSGNRNSAGSVPAESGTEYEAGAAIVLPAAGSLTRIGCSFGGWNTAADGSGTTYAAGASYTMPASDTTLYARWVSNALGELSAVGGGSFKREGAAGKTSAVSTFMMSRTEITQTQYMSVTSLANPSYQYFTPKDNTARPVDSVNWYQALVFCNLLSATEGYTPVYSIGGSRSPADWGIAPTTNDSTWNAAQADWTADGYRLPTEAEWQWAAMGGTDSPAKLFSGDNGSNAIGDCAWYIANSSNATQSAGTKTANELGIFDLSGNVSEWCWDWFGTYPDGAETDYHGPNSGMNRILRGGHWDATNDLLTVAERLHSESPSFQGHRYGFRVVR